LDLGERVGLRQRTPSAHVAGYATVKTTRDEHPSFSIPAACLFRRRWWLESEKKISPVPPGARGFEADGTVGS